MNPIRPLGPAVKAEVTAEYNGLPTGRITEQGTDAHVFTASLDDLTAWYLALGGHIACQTAGTGVTLWTLHTTTDHTDGIPVHVHALALDTEPVDSDLTDAVA